jgi:hypothetical protein
MLGVSCFFIVMSPECRVGGKSGDAGVGFRGLVDAAHPIVAGKGLPKVGGVTMSKPRAANFNFTPNLLDESFAKP